MSGACRAATPGGVPCQYQYLVAIQGAKSFMQAHSGHLFRADEYASGSGLL